MNIKLGPSGLGPYRTAKKFLEELSGSNLSACEITFTYGVYMSKEEAIEIGNEAKKRRISLSIHAPYFVNLNSDDPKKLFMSKKRILDCCEIGHYLGVKSIVFHAGFYGKDRKQAYENIKNQIKLLIEEIKKNKWDVELCPEIMGKVNVFGSIEEISKLVKDTGCSFCIDFAHILARYNERKFSDVEKSFPNKNWHIHFSGINYGDKGEKNHIPTEEGEWLELFNYLKKLDKKIVIISEAPEPLKDALFAREILDKG